MTHITCGTKVLVATRTVMTEPEDNGWPRNVTLGVPYCPTCKRLISIKEVQ